MSLVEQLSVNRALQKYFGFDAFKGEQESIIDSILNNEDTLVIMPTGGGKSLCYQLPGMMCKGTAIVVSPLIALMKNQVDMVRSYASNDSVAHYLNSSLTKTQVRKVKEDVLEGKTKLLYVAPETLNKESHFSFFEDFEISFIAVDEAHCISEWGHDFRPEYRRIRQMINNIGKPIPIIALTATATEKVRQDIVKTLEMNKTKIYLASFNRSNLFYEIRPKVKEDEVYKDLVRLIKSKSDQSGIVYCLSRKKTEEIAEILKVNGINAVSYHAGLDPSTRSDRQDQFLMEDVQVIVATIAFGMGIDKPDIRFVIHYNMSRSLESYYQETGRAGRDGLEGHCVAYFNHKDLLKLEKFLRDKPISEREIGSQLLMEVSAFCETSECRRQFLLHYFGERFEQEGCNKHCDNCKDPAKKFNGENEMKIAINAILSMKEKFGIEHIVHVLVGKNTQSIQAYKHNLIKYFGVGREKGETFWFSIIRKGILESLLFKDIESYGLVKVMPKGQAFLKNPHKIILSENKDFSRHDDDLVLVEKNDGSALDETLFQLLKDLRRSRSKTLGVPPFVIFQDPSLKDMANQYPATLQELEQVQGVSRGKAQRYGKEFVKLISDYVEENNIERPTDFVLKSVANKSAKKVFLIQNIDRKIPLDQIARSREIELDELLKEIEGIVDSGTKLNVDYYINELLDEEQQDIIYDYFYDAETDEIELALSSLSAHGFEAHEIQVMRIKFISDLGN
jgi:ATP-dependent DNA helicase RecQ